MDYMLPYLLEMRILNVRCNRLLVTWDHHRETQLVFMDSAMPAGSIRSEALLVSLFTSVLGEPACVCVQIPPVLTAKLAAAVLAESVSRKPCYPLLTVLLLVS